MISVVGNLIYKLENFIGISTYIIMLVLRLAPNRKTEVKPCWMGFIIGWVNTWKKNLRFTPWGARLAY